MIRELSVIDVLYLIAATRWTLALTAIAFVGGGLVGLAIALMRVSALPPLRWLYDYAWFVGFLVASVTYWIAMRNSLPHGGNVGRNESAALLRE